MPKPFQFSIRRMLAAIALCCAGLSDFFWLRHADFPGVGFFRSFFCRLAQSGQSIPAITVNLSLLYVTGNFFSVSNAQQTEGLTANICHLARAPMDMMHGLAAFPMKGSSTVSVNLFGRISGSAPVVEVCQRQEIADLAPNLKLLETA